MIWLLLLCNRRLKDYIILNKSVYINEINKNHYVFMGQYLYYTHHLNKF